MEKACAQADERSVGRWMGAWLPVVAYMALIFYFSSLSHPEENLPKFFFETLGDKLLHAIEYAVLGGLCYRAFRRAGGPRTAQYPILLAIVATSVYGATDEVHQVYVPLRTAAWSDWLADTAGAVIGAVGYRRVAEYGVKDGFS